VKLAFLGIWLGLAATIVATDEVVPAASAVAYLEALRSGDREIGAVLKETLLSPHCGPAKREAITARLTRQRVRLQEGDRQFELLAERWGGDYGAVLVAVLDQMNPGNIDVIPIGLRQQGGGWVVAPVPGSFENSNVPFDREVERRVAALEDWMRSERISHLENQLDAAMKRLGAQIAKSRPGRLLKKGAPAEVVDEFLRACEGRDLAKTLVFCMEGLDEEERWTMVNQVARGLQQADGSRGWNDLTSPEMVRVVGKEETDDNSSLVSVLCYDPDEMGGPYVLTFDLMRVGGQWQIDLPELLREPGDGRRRWKRTRTAEKLRKKFAECYERARPARRCASVEEAGRELADLLANGTLDDLFQLLPRGDDLTDGEKRMAYAQAARLWRSFHSQNEPIVPGRLVTQFVEGSAGLVVLLRPMAVRVDRINLETVLFFHDGDGWCLAPGVTVAGNFDAGPEALADSLRRAMVRYEENRTEFEKTAAESLLGRFELLRPGSGPPLTAEAAAKFVREFRGQLRKGNLTEALGQCGLIERSDGAIEGLKALSYEFRGARSGKQADQELLVAVRGGWAGVSLRVDSGPSDDPDYPLYLVLPGKDGPRIVVDAGLRLPTNPGRGILNGEVWAHLEAHLDKKEVGLVRDLYEGHRQHTLKDFEAWEKNSKSSR
jgi:hypothetical protein